MNAAPAGTNATIQAALTPFAMQFGIVPNGMRKNIGSEVIVFGEAGTPQVELQPMIHLDGTREDAGRIIGFPVPSEEVVIERQDGLAIPKDVWGYGFYRDWKLVSEMMDTRIGAFALAGDLAGRSAGKGLPDGLIPRDDSMWDDVSTDIEISGSVREFPDVGGLANVTLRDLVRELYAGSVDRPKVMGLGAYLFNEARATENYLVAANLYLGAGVLLGAIGSAKTAMVSFGSAAVSLPETQATARAIIMELSAQAMETPVSLSAAAAQWNNTLMNDPDFDSRILRLLRGMWSAWRAEDFGEMSKLMQFYTVVQQRGENHLEAAKGCVRAAWLFSKMLERGVEAKDPNGTLVGISALLSIAGDLFRRGGEEVLGAKARELADSI